MYYITAYTCSMLMFCLFNVDLKKSTKKVDVSRKLFVINIFVISMKHNLVYSGTNDLF